MSERKLIFLLVFFSILVGLVLAEVILRVLGIGFWQFYEYDPYCGGRLRAGDEGYWTREGYGFVRINSDGLRDREHSIAKSPRTIRIAVLGDSYAEAMQVNQKRAFWWILGELLNSSCSGTSAKTVEIINFGQSGFGTVQELQALRHRAKNMLLTLCSWPFSPGTILPIILHCSSDRTMIPITSFRVTRWC